MGWGDWFKKRAEEVGHVLHPIGEALQIPVDNVVGKPLGFASAYVAPLTDWANQLRIGNGHSGNRITDALPHFRIEHRIPREMPDSPADAWRRATQTPAPTGAALASLGGYRPEDPGYDRGIETLDLAGSFAFDPLLAAGKITQGAKLARTLPAGEGILDASKGRRALSLLPGSEGVAHGGLARRSYQALAKSPESLAGTSKARTAFADMAAHASPAYIADRYRLDTPLAVKIAGESDPGRVKDIFVAAVKGNAPAFDLVETNTKIADNADELARLQNDIDTGAVEAGQVAPKVQALLAEQGRLTAEQDRLAFYSREMPRATLTGAARQLVKRGTGGRVSRALSAIYNNKTAGGVLRNMFEVMPSGGEKLDLVDKSAGRVTLERVGHLLKIPRAQLDEHLDAFMQADGRQEGYTIYHRMLAEARNLHPELQEELLRTSRNAGDTLYHSSDVLEGNEAHEAVKIIGKEKFRIPQPQLDSELATELPVPSVAGIRELISLSGKGRQWLREVRMGDSHPVEEAVLNAAGRLGVSPKYLTSVFNPLDRSVNAAGRAVATSWAGTSRFAASATRSVWKPAVMMRLGFTGRNLGEEHLAMGALGLASIHHPIEMWKAMRGVGDFERFAELPEDALMSYARSEMGKMAVGVKVRRGDPSFAPSWRGELRQLNASVIARQHVRHMAADGEGEAAANRSIAYLADHPEGQQVWADKAQHEIAVYGDDAKRLEDPKWQPDPEELDLIQRKWLAGIEQRIIEKTRGNPMLMRLVRDGSVPMTISDYARLKFGGEPPAKIKDLVDEVNEYTKLSEAGPVPPPDAVRELESALQAPTYAGKHGMLKVKVDLGDADLVEHLLDGMPDAAKPRYVKGADKLAVEPRNPLGWVSTAFDWLAAKPSNVLSRSHGYRQLAAREYKRLTSIGFTGEKATEQASKYAQQQLKTYMFELGEKSALNEQMRVMAPFMNAWQQGARRWYLDVPGLQGFGIGQAAMFRRKQMFLQTLKQTGWAHDNDQGETVVTLPGMDAFVGHLTGVPIKTEIPLGRFTMVGQLTPGLGPVPNWLVSNVPGIKEQWDKPGPLRNTLDVLQPYGPESASGPAAMNRLFWAAFKHAPPWEQGRSADFQKYQWEYATIDASRAYDQKWAKDHGGKTWFQMYGDMPQGREKTIALQDFLDHTRDMTSHFYLARGLIGLSSPAQPNYQWPNDAEVKRFRTEMNKLADDDPQRQAMRDEFLHDHPNLAAFLIGKSRTTPFGPPLEAQPDGSKFDLDAYHREIRSGARTPLTAEEWTKFAGGQVNYSLMQMRYHDMLNAAGTSAPERLQNYALVKQANTWKYDQINRLEVGNPQWAADHAQIVEAAKQAGGDGASTWRDDLANQIVMAQAGVQTHLAELDPNGELDLSGFKQARSKVFDLMKEDPGLATRKGVDGDMARYFRDVSEPYYKQLDALFTKAKTLPKDERAPVYEQMRHLANDYQAPAGYPKPEAVAFYGLDKTQKADKVAKWATNPPGWLSDFQREQVGLEVNDNTRQFWDTVNNANNQVKAWMSENMIAPNSRQGMAAMLVVQQWKQEMANGLGLRREVELDAMTPFDRAWALDQVDQDRWGPVRQVVTTAQQALAAYSTSPDHSPLSIDSKIGQVLFDAWLVPWLEQARKASPELGDELDRWGRRLRPDDPLVGTDLYRRFLFDAFVR